MKSFKLIATAVAAACAVTSAPASEPTATFQNADIEIIPGWLTSDTKSKIAIFSTSGDSYIGAVHDHDLHELNTITMPIGKTRLGNVLKELVDGAWIVNDYRADWDIIPISLGYKNDRMQNDCITLSQTFFNSDAAYEYVMPICTTFVDQYERTDQHGNLWQIEEYHSLRATGLKIMSENGSELSQIVFPDDIKVENTDISLLELESNKYFVVIGSIPWASTGLQWDTPVKLFYLISSDGSKIELVRREEGDISTVQKGKNLILSFGENDGFDNVEIFDTTGRKTFESAVDNNVSQVTLNISDLNRGAYILRATSGAGKSLSCKIAIR